ncbi:MAG: XdhC family protein [Spirochaetaceae bacterium]|jgi:xanthine dehydrogenase accessory factor|nr:XdhC family protein [Spirochaetaceae bacterium]
MHSKDLFAAILEKTRSGEDTVLVTIIAEAGSSPRSAGAHMLVTQCGRVCGTIGGGTVEYKAVQFAQNILERRQSRRKTYRLYQNDEEELGMICGGDVDVYFQFIAGGDRKTISLAADCLARLEKDEDLWLFIDLTNSSDWTMTLYAADLPPAGMTVSEAGIQALTRNKGVLVSDGDRRIYGEPINTAGKVFIFGGGHVAQALQPLLAGVGFRCVVFDNREEFITRELFPAACDLIVGDYETVGGKFDIRPDDYLVIATHAYDLVVLRQTINKDCAYIGVIGSKTKAAAVKQELLRDGVCEERVNRINLPIGLPIKSETPEEIAVSIAGEMILRRAERRAGRK